MKGETKSIKNNFLDGMKITVNPALDNASKKGTEKKLQTAKAILSKTTLATNKKLEALH
jgi:hypothetical protein